MLLTASAAIDPDDTTGTLHDRVADLGGQMIVLALQRMASGTLVPRAQPLDGVCYAHKIEKQEGPLDWRLDALTLSRRVRAFNPFPGASLVAREETIKVWRAVAVQQTAQDSNLAVPGTVLAAGPEGVVVATGQGSLNLQQLQRPGGKRLTAAEFLRGFSLVAGDALQLVKDRR
jgi:methionyl-tRNA formyltransferase